MNIGYARVSKAGDAQNLDLQYDALTADGVAKGLCTKSQSSLDLNQGMTTSPHALQVPYIFV